MSKMDRPPVVGMARPIGLDGRDMRSAGGTLRAFGEGLVGFALLASWLGFWIAVIWWWLAR
jgi:hypothetical protein